MEQNQSSERLYPGGGGDGGLPNSDIGELGGAMPDLAGDVDLGTAAGRAAALNDPAAASENVEAYQTAQETTPSSGINAGPSNTPRGVLPTSNLAGAADVNPFEGAAGDLDRNTGTGSGGVDSTSHPSSLDNLA